MKLFAAAAALLLSAASAFALDDASIPVKVPTPWATSAPGANVTCPVPIPSQISITSGRASWTDGFPPVTFQPSGAGGVPPSGADFNGALCQLSQWTRWFNAGGPISYDASFQSLISGYPSGALVQSASTAGLFWRSTVDNNVSNPDSGGANWTSFPAPPLCGANGYRATNNSGSPNTQIDFIVLNSVLVATTGGFVNGAIAATLNFAVVGANGIDTGSIGASRIYHLWMISNGSTFAMLASLSATAPTMPSGYIYKCRAGAISTNSSSQLFGFTTIGASTYMLPFQSALTTLATGGSCSTPTLFSVAFSTVPTTVSTVTGTLSTQTSTANGIGLNASILLLANIGAANNVQTQVTVPMTTAQTIWYCSSSAGNAFGISAWTDSVNVR